MVDVVADGDRYDGQDGGIMKRRDYNWGDDVLWSS